MCDVVYPLMTSLRSIAVHLLASVVVNTGLIKTKTIEAKHIEISLDQTSTTTQKKAKTNMLVNIILNCELLTIKQKTDSFPGSLMAFVQGLGYTLTSLRIKWINKQILGLQNRNIWIIQDNLNELKLNLKKLL